MGCENAYIICVYQLHLFHLTDALIQSDWKTLNVHNVHSNSFYQGHVSNSTVEIVSEDTWAVTYLYLYLSVFVLFWSSEFLFCLSTFWRISCLSSVCLHVIWARAQPESTSSPFSYFRVSRSSILTSFTPRFLRSFALLPYFHALYHTM